MKQFLLFLVFISSTNLFAARQITVMQLPEPNISLTEVETNVVFSAGRPNDNKWLFFMELNPSVTNCVEVVFGIDKNTDGVLGLEEGMFCIGWDCGEWFWRDRLLNEECRISEEGDLRRLELFLYFKSDKTVSSISSNVFASDIPKTFFNTDFDLLRVISRGAEKINVESKFFSTGFKLCIR
jgi:hypothetical protein